MSIQSEIDRINSNVQSALNAVADTGVSVPENANSNDLPAAVLALTNEKQDKLTGTQGQVVGFDAEGNPVAQDKPSYTANDVGAIPASEKGTANGVATLGADGKVPSAQLPSLDYIPSSQKGAASGVATLGADGKVPTAQLPAMDYVPNSEKGAASGVATLGTDGKVPTGQLPEISSVKTFTATIGTTWTENEDTGVKSQSVPITGVLAKHTAKVDHAYTGSGTSDDYATFVEAENQYLTYITNGYAETYDGGITFYIFGDANTVSIPIVVEVA